MEFLYAGAGFVLGAFVMWRLGAPAWRRPVEVRSNSEAAEHYHYRIFDLSTWRRRKLRQTPGQVQEAETRAAGNP